jgi:hypothetical protein
MSYRPKRGMGWTVDSTGYGVLAPTYENCIGSSGVPETACTQRNQVLNDAWGAANLAQSNAKHLSDCLQSYPAATCHAQFDPGGAAAAVANAGQPVQGYVAAPVVIPQVAVAQPVAMPVLYPGGSPSGPPTAGPVVINSSGAAAVPANTPVSNPTDSTGQPISTASTGFDLSSIPWWGWVGAAAVALFAFSKGGR